MATVGTCTHSFAAISEDLHHDSSHALLATRATEDWLDKDSPLVANIIYVSDGAASHFKNRYRLYKLEKSSFTSATWLLTETGHGKGPRDGICGIVKHQATTHNLRSPESDAIMSAQDTVESL